jgi:precorrin-6B methylase 1
MSFVIAQADLVAGAARNLASIGSAISEATVAAGAPTTSIMVAGADEVSAAVAAQSARTPWNTRPSAPKYQHFIRTLCRL